MAGVWWVRARVDQQQGIREWTIKACVQQHKEF